MMETDDFEAGTAALKAHNFDEAERVGRKMLAGPTPAAEAYHLIGCAMVLTSRRDEGIKYLVKASELSPASYPYARNFVSQLCRRERFSEASLALERFAGASPDPTKISDLRHIFEQASGLKPADHAHTFEEIYRSNAWNSGSGYGSTAQATQAYRAFLQDFVRLNGITSVVDVGCGDWSFSRLIDWTGVNYTGVDVSETAVARARQYQSNTVQFLVLNAMTEPLPSADLLIVKDVLQHWPNRDIQQFLAKVRAIDRALITNRLADQSGRANRDIRLGDVRALHLARSPFHLRGSIVFRFRADEEKAVFLWHKP